MTIREFQSHVLKEGLARQNRFQMEIYLPSAVLANQQFADAGISGTKRLMFACKTSELPGRNLNTADHQYLGFNRKKPYSSLYDTITLTFRMSESMVEKKLFDFWMSLIIDPFTQRVGYEEDYVTDMIVHQLDSRDGVPTETVTFVDAFPITLNALPVSFESRDSIHELTVVFAYRYWYTPEMMDRRNGRVAIAGASIQEQGGFLSAVAGALSTVRKYTSQINSIMQDLENNLDLAQGETSNYFAQLARTVQEQTNLPVSDVLISVRGIEGDITDVNDTNILSNSNKTELLGATGSIINLFSQ
ncbi:MAG: hypothetical protein BV459_01795 [Thermoplasmata archaeon M11B2D]|nr:MAG: hypothetical protein BV459_01795 [Thermoplasmata archaeon M11B2D]